MNLLGRLFQSSHKVSTRMEPRLAAITPVPAVQPLNPKMAGNFLMHQLLLSNDSKFGIPESKILAFGADLPESIRTVVKVIPIFG